MNTQPDVTLTRAKELLTGECEFLRGVVALDGLPSPHFPEVAVIGRSNVGKSSLINAITAKKGMARASNTPGRTQQLNFFLLAKRLMLVDLPGYGYAKAPKPMVREWNLLIRQYLCGRPNLRRVCLLIDSRHGIKPSDEEMMEMLDETAVPFQLVLTKADKISNNAQEEIVAATKAAVKKHPAAHPEIVLTSAETGLGIDTLRVELANFYYA